MPARACASTSDCPSPISEPELSPRCHRPTTVDTTKLEVNLPTDTPVASVSLKPVGGWTAAAEKVKLATPIKSDDGEISEAVTKITWTAQAGAAVKPGQFQEFDTSLGPLPQAGQMVFKAKGDGDGTPWGVAGIVPGLAGLVLGLLAYRRSGRTALAPGTTGAEPVTAGKVG